MDYLLLFFFAAVIALALISSHIRKKEETKCDICNANLSSDEKKLTIDGGKLNCCPHCYDEYTKNISSTKESIPKEIKTTILGHAYESADHPDARIEKLPRKNRGFTVTQFVKKTKQPRGGFLKRTELERVEINDGILLSENENIHASLVGLAVDYLTRYMIFGDAEASFDISIRGASLLGQAEEAEKLISTIDELNRDTVISACKLSGFDVVYRSGPMGFKDIDLINPDENTIENIITMVNRAVSFFKKEKVILSGMTFEGGYTDLIVRGDADFMSSGTIWDMKVSKNEPTKDQTLQLLIYCILSNRCGKYPEVNRIGILNPRKNTYYTYRMNDMPPETITEIKEVMGAT